MPLSAAPGHLLFHQRLSSSPKRQNDVHICVGRRAPYVEAATQFARALRMHCCRPLYPAVLMLAYFSNLSASLTHYGTTPAPILFGAGYVRMQTWWKLGLIASIANIPIWTILGFTWWKVLGLW